MGDTLGKKVLVRETKRLALIRMEEAARTKADFRKVKQKWDTLEASAERRQRRYGFYTNEEVMDWLLAGYNNPDYLEMIFNNHDEFPVLIEDIDIFKLVRALREKPKDLLYWSAIRLHTFQQIANFEGKTDRAIRKMNTKMMSELRSDLVEKLIIRIGKNREITNSQRLFLEWYLLELYLQMKGERDNALKTY